MAQPATKTTRQLSLERRRALSTNGKTALGNAANAPARPSGVIKPKKAAPASAVRGAAAAPRSSLSATSTSSPGKIAATPAAVSRQASRNRRLAMSSGGKAKLVSSDRTRATEMQAAPAQASATPAAAATSKAEGCGCGCGGKKAECKTKMAGNTSEATRAPLSATVKKAFAKNNNQALNKPQARLASLARREAMSKRGKAGISKGGMSEAQTARAGNPGLSARDLSKKVREQRSKIGGAGKKSTGPCGKQRPAKANVNTGAAQDAPWKVGASETVEGQTVTGTMVGRSESVTGDEPSTCRGITGTEYLGADIFRNFCQTDPKASTARKVNVTTTSHGNPVSGNRLGRGENVTGNEQGTCKNVTGDEYTSAEQSQGYCGELAKKSPRKISMAETMKGKAVTGDNVGRSESVTGDEPGMSRALTGTQYTKPEEIGNAPAKVGVSSTLRGGSVTGTMVGRREKMTGDEAGSCRNVTGDDYVGAEQYSGFCSTTAEAPTDNKVGVSATGKGLSVTGTMTGRSGRVTGNEPGTCKSVTGTPYASADQTGNFCQAEDAAMASMRNRELRSTPAMPLTGLQPGVGGVMTGADKGACEAVSGTPYVGADQFAAACPATAATTASPDYPQAIGGNAVGQQFSVTTPSGGAAAAIGSTGVTGNQYEKGHITGPFGMATGKVTGTEDARFGKENVNAVAMRPEPVTEVDGRAKSRVSGEGQDSGLNITGDDWGRGEHVTGTEGMSSTRRNPTIRANNSMAAMAEMAAIAQKRNEEVAIPNSKVTGGSGNTEKGSLITYSGGARG